MKHQILSFGYDKKLGVLLVKRNFNYGNLEFNNGFGGFDTSSGEYIIYKSPPVPWINCISAAEGEPFGFIISEKGGGYVWHGNSRENPITRWYCDPLEDLSDERIEITEFTEEGENSISPFSNCITHHGYGYSSFKGEYNGIEWCFTTFVPINKCVKITLFEITSEKEKKLSLKYSVETPYRHEMYSSAENIRKAVSKGDTWKGVLLLSDNKTVLQEYTRYEACSEALEKVKDYWSEYLGRIRITTPEKSINVMMNGWLLYQTVSCRLNGRTAFYQCGGAYGFRDQLQDSLALLCTYPQKVKERILLHASRQYEEGDVQHWWHPPENAGIRSRYSDDLLWLVYVTFRYIEVTGDSGILDIKVPYIKSKPLDFNEIDRYEIPEVSEKSESLFSHCLLACRHAMRYGEHGIPLIMGGDWNDGMNRVGIQGKGESVWLGWFLCYCLKALDKMSLLSQSAKVDRHRLQTETKKIADAIEKHAWDGNWYIRAFCDNGRVLGSHRSGECMIDSIAQSWAVLSGFGNKERCKTALLSAERFLADYNNGIIKLLTPPFSADSIEDVGYIASYPAGIRENGAQYTHGAVWLAKAFLKMGDDFAKKGRRMVDVINPINHTRTELEVARYKTEPYAVAADIYSDENIGRGGWTWYTGSSSWLYQVILEDILGFTVKNSEIKGKAEIVLNANIPDEWKEYTIEYKYKNSVYIITVKSKGCKTIKLEDDGKVHKILI